MAVNRFLSVEELEAIVLNVEYNDGVDQYILLKRGQDEILLERTLSDTESEYVSIITNVELSQALESMDKQKIVEVLSVDYPEVPKINIEVYKGNKAKLLVRSLMMNNPELEEILKVFLI